MSKLNHRTPAFLAALLLLAVSAPSFGAFSKDEIKMGQEASKEIEKEVKLSKDEAAIKRVTDIGQALVKASDEPDAVYSFKVIDDKEVNAFALPGGFVYVYKGLLDKVESNDELAGVLSHEIIHAKHHHAMRLTKKQKPWDLATMAVLLAGVLSGRDVSGGAQLVGILNTAKINGYTIDLEREADADGLKLMMKSSYHPVGMLTFMERLAREEARSAAAQIELGIFRTHPYSPERAASLKKALEDNNIPLQRRMVMKTLRVAVEATKVNDQEAATLKLDDQPVMTFAPDGKTGALDRAQSIADKMNKLLDEELRGREVWVDKAGTTVVARNSPLIRISEADARLAGRSTQSLADEAARNIQKVLWNEYLRWNT